MPAQYTLPPDTRAVGQGNPPADMNAVIDGLSAVGAGSNILNAAFAGGADPTGANDSTAAIQAALNAGTGAVIIPPGAYKVNSASLTVTGPVIIQGSGNSSQLTWDQTAIGTLFKSSGTQQYIQLRDLRLSQSNATPGGTAIEASGWQFSQIQRVTIDKTGSGAFPNIAVSYNSSPTHYNLISDCTINCDGTSGIGVRYDTGANSNVLRNCRILPSTSDATQTGVYVNANSIELDHPDIEQAAGTGVSLGALGHSCTIRDAYMESNGTHVVFASGVSNPLIIGGTYLTPGTAMFTDNGAIAPSWINMRSGTATPFTKAIFQQLSSNGQILRVINRQGSPTDVVLRAETLNGGELAIGAKATSDTANRWQLDSAGKQTWGSGSGAGDTNLYRSAANTLATDDSLTVGIGLSVNGSAVCTTLPSDMSYLAWTFDPVSAGGTGTALPTSAGVIELIKIPLWGQSFSATGAALHLTTLGASLTSTENWIYLFSSAGTFIAATADQTTTWNTGGTTGLLTPAWASGPFTVSGTFCWIGLVWNGTTAPSFLRGSSNTAAFANGRLAAASSRYGSAGSGKTTNTPGNITPSGIAQNAPAFWAALY